MKIIAIKSICEKTLFEFECDNNTIKKTLIEAVKQKVNLFGADLCCVNLSCADLHGANLHGVCLSGSNLCYANLENANLDDVSLFGTSLHGANLKNANLYDADLYNTDLRESNLQGAKLPFIPMNLPDGEFIAYKRLQNGLVAKIKILEESKRSRGTWDSCRCDKALVLELQNKDGSKAESQQFISYKYAECAYIAGEIVRSDSWDEDRWNNDTHGIHFFLDRQKAANYHCN